MLARLCGFFVWALVAAGVVFWGLRLFVKGPAAPPNALPVAEATLARGDLTRLFGPSPAAADVVVAAPPGLASRFRLYGVMAPRAAASAPATHGLALIAVDGKPARPYAVGAELDTDLIVQSVSLRTAAIGPPRGAASVLLELAPPVPAATGVPGVGAAGLAPALPVSPPPPPPPVALPMPGFNAPAALVAPGSVAAPASGGIGLPRRGIATQ